MALDGLSYLSVDVPAVVGRPRSPRRSPRLRMNEEDEDEVDKERSSRNVGIRAPIIGYEVIDQRQKFTVRLQSYFFNFKFLSTVGVKRISETCSHCLYIAIRRQRCFGSFGLMYMYEARDFDL